jgi:hypothetical protein
MTTLPAWRCGISAGGGKRCNKILEPIPGISIFAAGHVDQGDSPLRVAECPKHGKLYAPQQEIDRAVAERQAVMHFWRFDRRSRLDRG